MGNKFDKLKEKAGKAVDEVKNTLKGAKEEVVEVAEDVKEEFKEEFTDKDETTDTVGLETLKEEEEGTNIVEPEVEKEARKKEDIELVHPKGKE